MQVWRRCTAADPVDVAFNLCEGAVVNFIEECAVVTIAGDELNSLVERRVLARSVRINSGLRRLLVDGLFLAVALRNACAITSAVKGD